MLLIGYKYNSHNQPITYGLTLHFQKVKETFYRFNQQFHVPLTGKAFQARLSLLMASDGEEMRNFNIREEDDHQRSDDYQMRRPEPVADLLQISSSYSPTNQIGGTVRQTRSVVQETVQDGGVNDGDSEREWRFEKSKE